jgi:hypothetical protein
MTREPVCWSQNYLITVPIKFRNTKRERVMFKLLMQSYHVKVEVFEGTTRLIICLVPSKFRLIATGRLQYIELSRWFPGLSVKARSASLFQRRRAVIHPRLLDPVFLNRFFAHLLLHFWLVSRKLNSLKRKHHYLRLYWGSAFLRLY